MRFCFVSLFLFAAVMVGLADDRIWRTFPHRNAEYSGGNQARNIAYLTVYINAVWSNWPGDVTKPDVYFSNAWTNNHNLLLGAYVGTRKNTGFQGQYYEVGHMEIYPPYQAPPSAADMFGTLSGLSGGSNFYTIKKDYYDYNYVETGGGDDNQVYYDDYLSVTLVYDTNAPPDTNYYCYFDLEGVFYSEDPSGYMTAELWVVEPEYIFVNLANYTISVNGAYQKSYGPYLLPQEYASMYQHYWLVFISGGTFGHEEYRLDGPVMSGSYENNHHYVTAFDFTILNTNAPYIPEIPTNIPPQYPPMPPAWDTNIYGPYPPYYSPWPPAVSGSAAFDRVAGISAAELGLQYEQPI